MHKKKTAKFIKFYFSQSIHKINIYFICTKISILDVLQKQQIRFFVKKVVSFSQKMIKVEIGVIGEDCAGKSQIINRYINNDFNEQYTKTISLSLFRCEADLEDKQYDLVIKDIPSNQGYQVYQKIHAFIIVFDINDPNYFENIRKNINKSMNNPCIILFGNKADDDHECSECKNELQKEFKQEIFFGSAKTGFNIDEVFGRAVELVTLNYTINDEGKFVKKETENKEEKEKEIEKAEQRESVSQSQCCLLI